MNKEIELFAVLIALVSLILYIFYGIPEFRDFTISVDPMEVDIGQGSNTNIIVEVHSGWLYHKDVSLRAESVPSLPSDVSFHFKPTKLKHGDESISQATIVIGENASPREYVISIIGDGPDGKENDCKLKLKVSGQTPNSAPKTKISTSTPTINSKTSASIPISEIETKASASNEFNTSSVIGDVPVTYTPINISEYSSCSFTATESTFYTHLPEGYSYVSLTININNTGAKPISSSPSCWKFIYNEISYVPDSFSTFSHFVLSKELIFADVFDTFMPSDIKPGENSTFILYYVVKGEPPKYGSILYIDPYLQI